MIFSIRGSGKKQGSEDELLEVFRKSGDLGALGELYSGYMHLVYGVCLKYLKDRDESKDAVMQIFEKLITEIPRHEIANFRSWLHVLTKNFCLMQLRSGKTLQEKREEWLAESEFFMEYDHELHPIDENGGEMEAALRDCIDRLKEDQKSCIRMFYFENKCYNEIAKDLSMDEKKVKSYLQNGKRNLKICLEEKNGRK
ncbi:MAG TPA: sigma-70 family RNA polymerase sigma factor [Bacteroidales bacterium]|nr:sigma-70 family RNA polymerase sigma factor [Bacteroidales bacterium]